MSRPAGQLAVQQIAPHRCVEREIMYRAIALAGRAFSIRICIWGGGHALCKQGTQSDMKHQASLVFRPRADFT